MAFAVSTARTWPLLPVDHGPEHLNSPANTYYQSPSSDDNSTLFGDATLVQGSFGTWYILPSTSWTIQLLAYAMPSVPVPPITLM